MNKFNFKTPHGTDYDKPALVIPEASKYIPGLINAGYKPFKQTIYFNPLSISGNFKFRVRHWHWNKHVPATNTGRDVINSFFIDYGDDTDTLYEINPINDRITGFYDYSSFVEEHYNKCKEEYDSNPDMSIEEYYNKLFSFSVTVTFYIRDYEVTAGLYPDELESLHEQRLNGRIGRFYHDLEMNILFPKLVSMSHDIFYNYTYFEKNLLRNCDRLLDIDPRTFDTLVDQETLESWFENSGVYRLSSRTFEKMSKVSSIKNICKNSNLQELGFMTFYHLGYISNFQSAFYNSKLRKIGNDIFNILPEAGELYCESMFAEIPYLITKTDYCMKHFQTTNLIHSLNMWGNVISEISPETFMQGLITDGYPINIIYTDIADTNTDGMDCMFLKYYIKKEVTLEELSLSIPAFDSSESFIKLTNSTQLTSRIVIEASFLDEKLAYDPNIEREFIIKPLIGKRRLLPGSMWIKIYYNKNNADIIGVNLYTKNQHGMIDRDLIVDEVVLSINGILPKSPRILPIEKVYHELRDIENTDTFFSMYDKYEVDGLFADLPFFISLDEKLLAPLVNNTHFRSLIKNNIGLYSILKIFKYNINLIDLSNAFYNVKVYEMDPDIFETNINLEKIENTFMKAENLIINESHKELLKNNNKIKNVKSLFKECLSLISRIYISHLVNCFDFREMYSNCGGLIIRDDLKWKQTNKDDSILDKFGNTIIQDEFSIPDYSILTQKPLDVLLDKMYYNIHSSSIILNPIIGLKGIRYSITDMYSHIQSYFSDIFLFKGLDIKGKSNIHTKNPTTIYNVICDGNKLNLSPAVKYYGIELLGNKNTQVDVSDTYNVFYPELPFNENIEVSIINKTKDIKITTTTQLTALNAKRRNVFKRRLSKRIDEETKIEFVYVENHGSYIKENLEIPYHPLELSIDPIDLPGFNIGDKLEISITNRFIPIIPADFTITEISGEFPFSRVEFLDTTRFKNLILKESLFLHMFLSTGISLINTSFIDNTEQEYIFDEIDFKKVFPHLKTLNNFVINSPNLIGLTKNNNIDIFDGMNILLADSTFLNNTKQSIYYPIQSLIEMNKTYKATSVLSNPVKGEHLSLKIATYVFENELSEDADIQLITPLLENITGIFKGSNFNSINENPFIGDNIITANEMFMNSKLLVYKHILDTHPVKYINHFLDGSGIKKVSELIPQGTVISANYALANCNPENISIDFIRKNILCISANHLFYKTPVDASILYIDGMYSLMDASYILAENDLSFISPSFFRTNINLVNLEGALYKHKMELIPDGLLAGINNLKSLKRFTGLAEHLVKLPNLGCLIKRSDEVFDFSEFADRCYNVDFLQKKFIDIIQPYRNDVSTLYIENSLNQIKTSFTDIELADGKFLIEGKSNAIYVPSASIDIKGLNEFIIDFTYIGEEEWIDFKFWDYKTSEMKSIKRANLLRRSNRCVVFINDTAYGLNRLLDSPINPQLFPKIKLIPNTHYNIKIYTEPYETTKGMMDGEVITIGNINKSLIETSLSGYFPIGPVKANNRQLSIRDILGININLVDIYHLKFNNPLYPDNAFVSSGYFKDFNFTRINLDNILFSPNHMMNMFEGCSKLKIVDITKPILLNGKGVNLTNFFKGCPIEKFPIDKPLSYYFDMLKIEGGFKVINTPIYLNNMFEGCKLKNINKVFDFVSTRDNQITFIKPNTYKDLTIDLTGMYSNSDINSISNGVINIDSVNYRVKHPSFIFDQMFIRSKIEQIPKYAFNLNGVSNLTSFKNTFESNLNLINIEYPMIKLCWNWDFMEYENDFHIEGLFKLSTNLKWGRTTIHHLIEYCDDEHIPYTYYSYAMLENIISHNPDDKIFRGVVYVGDTLAIYENIGPDISGMNRFRMYFDIRKLISEDYLFRIFGPTTSKVKFTDLTNLNTSILNSKLYVVINEDLPNAIEYYPNESKTIRMVSVTTSQNDQRVLRMFNSSREYKEEYDTICFDIYTDNNPNEIEIKELLGCLKANQSSLVLGIRVEGSLGYSLKYQSQGLLVTDILGKDAETKLYSIGDELFNNYNEVTVIKSMDNEYNYSKSLLAGIKGCDFLGENIFTPFKLQNDLIGILAETSFNEIDENIFNKLNCKNLLDLFASANVPSNLNEKHFNNKNILNISGMFYKATNTNIMIHNVLNKLTSVVTANHLYALSDIKIPHVDMFRGLINLENNEYCFYKTNIKTCPTIYDRTPKLVSVKSLFEGSTLESISDRLLANKEHLKYIDKLIKDCEKFNNLPENTFINSNNIDSSTYMAYNTPLLHEISENLLKSFTSCRYAKHMFDSSGLKVYPQKLMKSFTSLINGDYLFANIIYPVKIPDQYLSALVSANSIKGIFSGEGMLSDCGVDVLPHSTALENVQELFKSKALIESIDDDYFKYTPNVKYIDDYMSECVSLIRLPNITYLTNLETVSGSHKNNKSLLEIPSRYYYFNRKIYNYDNAFFGGVKIKKLGKELLNFDFSLSNKISLLSMFEESSNINLHYDLITEYIANANNITDDKKLYVDNMFNFVKTFLDEQTVWQPLKGSKVGDSKLTHMDPPSTDISGLHKLEFKLIPASIPMKKTYKLKTLHDMKIPVDTTSFKGRVVIYLDNKELKSYDNNIYYAEELKDIILPDIDSEHIITIYTESEEDLVVIHNAGEFINSNLDDDEILLKKEELPKIEIYGGFNSGLSKLKDFRLVDIFTVLETDQKGLKYIGYPIIKITSDIIKNVKNTLPRKEVVDGGFFSELYCRELPINLIPNKLYSPKGSLFEITEGLICKNPKLESIPEDILLKLDFKKLTYFNGECLALQRISNFIPMQNTIISLDYMCYKCISLMDIDEYFGSALVDVSMNSFFEECSKMLGLSEKFINNFRGKINSMNKFAYKSGFILLNESWIHLLKDVTSAKYAFAYSKIISIPRSLFRDAIKLRTFDNDSPIEGMFSNILSLVNIEGPLELEPSNRDLRSLFSESINLKWGNKRIFRQLYKTPPRKAIINDSFKNIPIPLDNDDQLFEKIQITGKSNAFFTGRIPPSTDTSGLSKLSIFFKLTDSSNLEIIPKIKTSEELIEKLTDTKQIKNRVVFKIYKINTENQETLVEAIGYDDHYEEDQVKSIILEKDLINSYRIDIYTKDEYIGFDLSKFIETKIDGVFPLNILNTDDTLTPIVDMFSLKVNVFGDHLLTGLNKTKLDLSNAPFNMKENLIAIGSLLNPLIDQEILDMQFTNCVELTNKNINISNLRKLKSIRYLFKGCHKIDLDITEFIKQFVDLEDITGFLENATYHNLTDQTFKPHIHLKYAKYFIKDTETKNVPENLFKFNLELVSIAGSFMNCPLDNIPSTLGCNPGCYSIERVYFNCRTIKTPLSRTVAELIYNGQPADTVKIIDAFYQVPVTFKDEISFITPIRFTQGSTGAIFNQKGGVK